MVASTEKSMLLSHLIKKMSKKLFINLEKSKFASSL